jgi:ubiquinone/menaquinone biosynthesis C-methylase UbiE
MSDTAAFDGISDAYAQYRPQYPTRVLERLWGYALADTDALQSTGLAIDVGAGTGISTLALLQSGPDWIEIVAVEPGRDMRLEAECVLGGHGGVTVIDGQAENLPFGDNAVGLVIVAQAIQWFDREAFYGEASRVLTNGGCLGLLQNNRNWHASPLLGAYETFLEEHGQSYSRHYRDIPLADELRVLAGFGEVMAMQAEWVRTMKLEEVIGLARSSTKMRPVLTRYGEQTAITMLSDALARHVDDRENVRVPYTTELFMTRRA